MNVVPKCAMLSAEKHGKENRMNSVLAFFSSTILAVMLQMNQGLSAQYGAYHAALYIHLVAAIFAVCVLLWKRKLRSAFRRVPLWMYLGGVLGVVTMLCNNLSYGHISLTSIMSLGIFAQIVLSALMDRFGWFETAKGNTGGITGIIIALVGVVWLLDTSIQDAGLYLLLSLGAGAAVILTRVVNVLRKSVGELCAGGLVIGYFDDGSDLHRLLRIVSIFQ